MAPDMGRPADVTDDKILEVVETSRDPVLTTAEIAGELPIGERGLRDRLLELAERGEIATKMIGHSRAWYAAGLIQETRQDATTPTQERASADEGLGPPVAPERASADVSALPGETDVPPEIEEINLPGENNDHLKARREALAAVYRYLRANGEAPRSELEENVLKGRLDAMGYSTTYSAWKNAIGPALSELGEVLDELEPPVGGRYAWTFIE